MLSIPVMIDERSYDLFVGLQDDNLERMRDHDPCDVRMHLLGAPYTNLTLREVVVGYVSAGDLAHIETLRGRNASVEEVLAYLFRGYQWRPEMGDGGKVRGFGMRRQS